MCELLFNLYLGKTMKSNETNVCQEVLVVIFEEKKTMNRISKTHQNEVQISTEASCKKHAHQLTNTHLSSDQTTISCFHSCCAEGYHVQCSNCTCKAT